MQLDEYGAAARGVQFVDYPRNERERTRMLNERSDAREAIISAAKSEKDARGIIMMLGLDSDDDLRNAPVAEPVPGDASPVRGTCCGVYGCCVDPTTEPAHISLVNAQVGDLRRVLNERRAA